MKLTKIIKKKKTNKLTPHFLKKQIKAITHKTIGIQTVLNSTNKTQKKYRYKLGRMKNNDDILLLFLADSKVIPQGHHNARCFFFFIKLFYTITNQNDETSTSHQKIKLKYFTKILKKN